MFLQQTPNGQKGLNLTLPPHPPSVELLHLLGGAGAREALGALGGLAGSLPHGGPVDVVHVEHPAVAVDTGLPVCQGRGGWGGERSGRPGGVWGEGLASGASLIWGPGGPTASSRLQPGGMAKPLGAGVPPWCSEVKVHHVCVRELPDRKRERWQQEAPSQPSTRGQGYKNVTLTPMQRYWLVSRRITEEEHWTHEHIEYLHRYIYRGVG